MVHLLLFHSQLFPPETFPKDTTNIHIIESRPYYNSHLLKFKIGYQHECVLLYADSLVKKGYHVTIHQTFTQSKHQLDIPKDCFVFDPVDMLLQQYLPRNIQVLSTPQYIVTQEDIKELPETTKNAQFYQHMKEKYGLHGKSLDEQNRSHYTKEQEAKAKRLNGQLRRPKYRFSGETIRFVGKYFKNNIGEDIDSSPFPFTRGQALHHLDVFFEKILKHFGEFQDNMDSNEQFMQHSLLTPMLNQGLLLDRDIVKRILELPRGFMGNSNYEGFVRQILGWRNYNVYFYVRFGIPKSNYFGNHRQLSSKFYTGKTGILPVDDCITKLLKNGYCHHIERLMVLGCFMLLCEVNPQEVYRWFFEMFVDSNDAFMITNVLRMSQYVDGGKMMTRPYLCSSNYIRNMSNYESGEWCDIWDALYKCFVIERDIKYYNVQQRGYQEAKNIKRGYMRYLNNE